jgi:tetratricopeptide (TPR) repeat protein
MASELVERLSGASPAKRRALIVAWCSLLLVALFTGRLAGEFVWDDVPLVAQNTSLTDPGGLRRLMTQDLWGSAGQASTQLYHPLPMLTFWLEAHTHGLQMVALRLVNVALHLGCALAFCALLLRRGLAVLAALVATTLFLSHPLATEPVMWLTGRHDTLAALATLLALLCFPKPGDQRPWLRAGASGLCCAAAFASKEPYVVAPALVAGLSLVERPRGASLARLAALWLPPLAGVLAIVLLRRALHIPTGSAQLAAPLLVHLQNLTSIALHYGRLAVTFDQGPTISSYHLAGGGAVAAFWLLALALAALLWRRRAADLLFGAGWFLLCLLPHLLSLPVLGLWGNRYGYFPLLGGLWMLGVLVDRLLSRGPLLARQGLPLVAAGLTLLCLLQTRTAAALWVDDLTLYGASVEAAPEDGRALYHYAHAVRRRSGCSGAVALFFRAAQLDPSYPRAQRNLAGCLLDLGEPRRAVTPALRAVELEPEVASHHYNLGAALVGSGDRERGQAELRRALELDPGHRAARRLLAELH